MKRKLLSVILVFFIVCLLPIPVSAHRGRTDSNGGHYDRSTGEYHYHHGYPEHQHYDMDGDGDLDCPYDFNDRTDSNSGSAGSTYLSAEAWLASQGENEDRYEDGYDSGYDDGYEKGNREGYEDGSKYGYDNGYTDGLEEGRKGKVSNKLLILAVAMVVIMGIMLRIRRNSLNETEDLLDETRKKLHDSEQREKTLADKMRRADIEHRNALEVRDKKAQDQIRLAENKISLAEEEVRNVQRKYSEEIHKAKALAESFKNQNDSLMEFLGMGKHDDSGKDSPENKLVIPLGISFADDGLPILGKQTPQKRYGDYTVFVCDGGSVYHERSLCSNGYTRPVHIFEVVGKRRPCARCCNGALPKEVPQWYKAIRARRYNMKG